MSLQPVQNKDDLFVENMPICQQRIVIIKELFFFFGGGGGGRRRGLEWGIEIFHDVLSKYLLIISRIRLLID